jgi:NADPH:quinone reductase-like Zn-dependent oxidoreductase
MIVGESAVLALKRDKRREGSPSMTSNRVRHGDAPPVASKEKKTATGAHAERLHAIPKTMHAVAFDHPGGPEVLSVHVLPVPELDANEVLIAVHTAGVGVWDADIREGWSPGGRRPHYPLVLGSDGSGTVAAVGSRVRRFKPGDRVYAYGWDNPKGGFYAEYVALAADNVAHIPEPLDLKHAGAAPVSGLTALQGIDDALHVKKSQAVIVHGASGAVGSLALQFAKLRGARVLATASGEDGVAFVRDLGADMAVDGRHGDIAAAVSRFAPDGVDAVLALADGAALERCVEAVRNDGIVAYPNGVEPEPKKRRGVKIIPYDGTAGVRQFDHLNHAIEAARPKIKIAAEYPLAEASKAHERLAAGHVVGKVVLRVRR